MDNRMTAAEYAGAKNGVAKSETVGEVGQGTYRALCSCLAFVERIEVALHGAVPSAGASELRSTPAIVAAQRENYELASQLNKRLGQILEVLDAGPVTDIAR